MSSAAIKFRCSRCSQLLGASRSKVGAVISCPKCRAELIVPDPADGPPAGADLPVEPDPAQVLRELINFAPESPSPVPELRGDVPVVVPVPLPFTVPLAAPAVETPEVVVPSIQLEPPSIAPARGTVSRHRDVVMPRTAVVAWSLFVLLALLAAFAAGLLAGHFLWVR
jgi:DNA-directed RNA polymerase subunit RPC12/RpoP